MEQSRLQKILEDHRLWLESAGGSRADLSCANLIDANLSCADLIGADLSGANLSGANLSCANLIDANLRRANLIGANLIDANLRRADLSCADLSGAKGLLSAIAYLDAHFERVPDGYIAYKTFGSLHEPPKSWKIEPGSVIEETPNPDRCTECGSGINVAPLEWVRQHYEGNIWKLLIRWEWLPGVVVPFMTDGKIRCERAELIGIVQ